MNIVHGGVGPISESDVDLAQACGAFIVGFSIPTPPSSISQAASQAGIKVLILVKTTYGRHFSFECSYYMLKHYARTNFDFVADKNPSCDLPSSRGYW